MSAAAPVVVVGAGPTGLAAAHALVAAGRRVLVLEASQRVGGLSGSWDVAGFKVDYGPHRLHMAAGADVLALYSAALGGALRVRARSGVVHVGGRRVPYPLSVLGLARGLGLAEVARHGASAVAARLWRPRGEHFGAEAARRLGRHAARVLYVPAARKVWGLAPEELDPALGRARVQKGGPLAVLRAALGRGPAAAAGRRYFYPEGGFGALAEGLAEAVRRGGGEVRLGARVTGLEVAEGRVRAVRLEGGERVACAAVVATAPLPRLCAWAGAEAAAEGLGYRALTLLYLELARARASGHDVRYFADADVPASRLFEAKGFSGGDGPADRTVVGLDLPCAVGDATWAASAEVLRERVRPALVAAGLAEVPVLSAHVARVEAAYPLYRKGYGVLRERALNALARVEGLYPVGRQALFVHDNVHHACAAGLAAGRAAAAGASAAQWRAAQAPFLHAQIED